MARQTKSRSQASKRGQSNRTSRVSVDSIKKLASAKTYQNLWQGFQGNPKLMYAAGGVGAFFLIRSALRYYRSHPEILEFIKENIDTIETRIGEFRGNMSSGNDEVADARH